MYRRRTEGWLKHVDFIALDILCLQLSYFFAYCIRHGWGNPYAHGEYLSLGIYLVLADFLTMLLTKVLDNVVRRGYWDEAKSCLTSAILAMLLITVYLFFMQTSVLYSRTVVFMTGGIYLFLNYAVRCLWKAFLRKRGGEREKDSMLVAANTDRMVGILATLKEHSFNLPSIQGLILLDGEPGMEGFPYPVVANQETMTAYITRNWVDELLVDPGEPFDTDTYQALQKELDVIACSGVSVHSVICEEKSMGGRSRLVESVGGYTVLTDSIRIVSMRQAMFKRCLDIVGGLVGCLLAALVILVVGPMIYIQSPGPIIFKQTRIGRNGKTFTMYKLRSMCLDAEAKKAALAAANRVSDGMMFKLDFDPRIIGAKMLPDGTVKKGIGNYIRDFSLDEFPQFFNVLKGDMSLVGTRPPTMDEWVKYTPYHRARMTFRPGITGLWQISGRSDITDFDEVVRLDMEYIGNWSAGRDFRIMLETVKKVIHRDGAR